MIERAAAELLAVPGVALGSAAAAIKYAARDDLCIMTFAPGAAVAGVFTQSGFAAAPVQLCRERLSNARAATSKGIRALIVNSGNANAATGERGREDAVILCAGVAATLGVDAESVLPFSTGVIGEFLPVKKMQAGFTHCIEAARADGWPGFAQAIMTTDTVPKLFSAAAELPEAGGGCAKIVVTGAAKGAGMMRPDMATMLAFVATDARVTPQCAQRLVAELAAASFNRLTVDGDTSTNDSFVLCCSCVADNACIDGPGAPGYAELYRALLAVALPLAQAIVRDGEGATKFVTVEVCGGATERECLVVAYTVAQSPLVKTAIFAGDPNWGRFCMAIGRAGIDGLDQNKVALYLDDVCIARDGLVADDYDESEAAVVMQQDEYRVRIDLGRGRAVEEVWTTDLSYEYVRINAEYRT